MRGVVLAADQQVCGGIGAERRAGARGLWESAAGPVLGKSGCSSAHGWGKTAFAAVGGSTQASSLAGRRCIDGVARGTTAGGAAGGCGMRWSVQPVEFLRGGPQRPPVVAPPRTGKVERP